VPVIVQLSVTISPQIPEFLEFLEFPYYLIIESLGKPAGKPDCFKFEFSFSNLFSSDVQLVII